MFDKSKTSKLFRFLNRPKKVWSVEVLYVIVLKDISKYLVLDNPWKAFLKMERLTYNLGTIDTMLLQATIIRNYFVKTQTSVASFCPPDLSIIFSNGMYLEVSPL